MSQHWLLVIHILQQLRVEDDVRLVHLAFHHLLVIPVVHLLLQEILVVHSFFSLVVAAVFFRGIIIMLHIIFEEELGVLDLLV